MKIYGCRVYWQVLTGAVRNLQVLPLECLYIPIKEEYSTTGQLTIVTPLKCLILGQFMDLLPTFLFVKYVERHK